ncbi:MAG: hypothetical protein GX267_14275 [Fibrobacter sp.]|jgi:hypothetical protein|nr:hypothetical protein [Fibrobacter sp.]
MHKEIELLGALHIAISILYTLVFSAIYAVLFSKGFFSGEESSANIQLVIFAVVGVFLLLFAISGVTAALGIIRGRPWAQMMILILGCLDLICVPLGTALGIYTIWIFMHSEKSGLKMTKDESGDSKMVIGKQNSSVEMGMPLPGKKAQL